MAHLYSKQDLESIYILIYNNTNEIQTNNTNSKRDSMNKSKDIKISTLEKVNKKLAPNLGIHGTPFCYK